MRVGVFGGTFNPIHLGHLHVADRVQRLFGLARTHFVVASNPPHKPGLDLAPFVHRYAMVSLALSGSERMLPSTMELERPPSPFSIDTMRKFARRSPGGRRGLCFIAGGDSLFEVSGWRRGEELLASYNFVFVMRPGIEIRDPRRVLPGSIAGRIRDLRGLGPVQVRRQSSGEGTGRNRIYLVEVDAPDISASQVRHLAAQGRSLKRLLPAPVALYINKLRLYGER